MEDFRKKTTTFVSTNSKEFSLVQAGYCLSG